MPGMNILSLFRRTKSRYADNKVVEDFNRLVDEIEQRRIDEAAAIIGKDSAPTSEDINRVGKLLGGP